MPRIPADEGWDQRMGSEHGALITEHDALLTEHDALITEHDALITEHSQKLRTEKFHVSRTFG